MIKDPAKFTPRQALTRSGRLRGARRCLCSDGRASQPLMRGKGPHCSARPTWWGRTSDSPQNAVLEESCCCAPCSGSKPVLLRGDRPGPPRPMDRTGPRDLSSPPPPPALPPQGSLEHLRKTVSSQKCQRHQLSHSKCLRSTHSAARTVVGPSGPRESLASWDRHGACGTFWASAARRGPG